MKRYQDIDNHVKGDQAMKVSRPSNDQQVASFTNFNNFQVFKTH